ncbi:MAG TPA: hypothetical protein VIQ05_23255 [Tardiphaga sp.]
MSDAVPAHQTTETKSRSRATVVAESEGVPSRPRPISAKVRRAIQAMVRGNAKTITDAAAGAGLSREHLSRELSKPHIAEFLHQGVKRSLAVVSARAGAVKVELLDSDNAMVRDRASSFVLGLAGIKPDSAPMATSEQSAGGA